MSQITTVKITAKCSDLCFTVLVDEDGNEVAEKDGYVPDFMPGEHWGDYVILEIDAATGKLLNWKVPSQESLMEGVKGP